MTAAQKAAGEICDALFDRLPQLADRNDPRRRRDARDEAERLIAPILESYFEGMTMPWGEC